MKLRSRRLVVPLSLCLATTHASAAILTSGGVNFTPTAPANLTTVGTIDWAIWNNTSNTTNTIGFAPTNRKSGSPLRISSISPGGVAPNVRGVSSLSHTFSYTDGTSPATLTSATQGGIISLNGTGSGVKLSITGDPNQEYMVSIWGTGSGRTGTMTASLNGASNVSLVSDIFPATPRPANLFTFNFKPDTVSDLLNIEYLLDPGSGSNPFVGIQAIAISAASVATNPTLATSVSSVNFGGFLQNAALPSGTGISINNTGGTSSGSSVAISGAGAAKFTATALSPLNIPGSGSSTSTIGLAAGATATSGTFTANVEYSAPSMTNSLSASTVVSTITVGNASFHESLDTSTNFGPALTTSVNAGQVLTNVNLASNSNNASVIGGGPAKVGTTATIVNYSNTESGNTAETVRMQWRSRTATEADLANNPKALLSDVLRLTGMGTGADVGTFLLTMTYDLDQPQFAGLNENSIASSGELQLAWRNGSNEWVNAVQGNNGGTGGGGTFVGIATPTGSEPLGTWGVDTSGAGGTGYVWAVLNHNSDFAVIPEPSTLLGGSLFGLGLGLVMLRRRRSGNR